MITPQNNKNQKKSSGLLWLAIILLVSFGGEIVKSIGKIFKGDRASSDAFIGFVVFLGVLVVMFAVAAAKEKRKTAGSAEKQRAKEIFRQNMQRVLAEKEQPITCQHETGKNRYVSQLDEFLKNGIITKEEYNIMRQKYENLNIDDYH